MNDTEQLKKAICRTCGGIVPNHAPSVLDPDGVGHQGHKIVSQPTNLVDGGLRDILIKWPGGLHFSINPLAMGELAAHLQAAVREAEMQAVHRALDYVAENPEVWKKKLDRKQMIEGYKARQLKKGTI